MKPVMRPQNLPGQAALRASRIWPSRSTSSITAASTGVGLFQCVQPQAGQRSRVFAPPSSCDEIGASAVAQLTQNLVSKRHAGKTPVER